MCSNKVATRRRTNELIVLSTCSRIISTVFAFIMLRKTLSFSQGNDRMKEFLSMFRKVPLHSLKKKQERYSLWLLYWPQF